MLARVRAALRVARCGRCGAVLCGRRGKHGAEERRTCGNAASGRDEGDGGVRVEKTDGRGPREDKEELTGWACGTKTCWLNRCSQNAPSLHIPESAGARPVEPLQSVGVKVSSFETV